VSATTRTLTSVRAREVKPGDVTHFGDVPYTVTEVVAGGNGQIYLIMRSESGGVIVPERDPGEIVSVWR